MSSQPPDERPDAQELRGKGAASAPTDAQELRGKGAASAGPETRWPRWRITMLLGAVVLLAVTIADAALDDVPRSLYGAVFFTGYMLLAYGFFLAMNARREAARKKKEEE